MRNSPRLVQFAGANSGGRQHGMARGAAAWHRQMFAGHGLGRVVRCGVSGLPGVFEFSVRRGMHAPFGYLAMPGHTGHIGTHQRHRQQVQDHGKGGEPDRWVTESEHRTH